MVLDKELQFIGTCPTTGLPILSKPEWTDVPFGKDYSLTVSMVGDSIFWVRPSGYVTLQDLIHVMKLTEQAPAEAVPEGRPYIHIEDWSSFRGASLAARKYYMAEMPKRKRISSVIFCHVSSLFKVSVKLGKVLSMVKFPVHIVDDYSDAVRLAVEMQSKEKESGVNLVMVPSCQKKPPKDALPSVKKSICPVTSLVVTTKPQWTDIFIDNHLSASFSLIGKAVLCTVQKGTHSEMSVPRLLSERERIVIEAGLSGKKYAEIVDYSMHTGYVPNEARMIFTNFLLKEVATGNLLGFWVFNAPMFIKWAYNVGTKIYKKLSCVYIVKDYEEAITAAVNVLQKSGVQVGDRQCKRFTKDEWGFESDRYGTRFELIGDDLIYTVPHGRMKERHVDEILALHEKVLEEAGLTAKGFFYRIINWENMERTTWKAGKMYVDGIKDLNRKIPCKLSVVYGMNKFMSKLLAFSRQFVPIPVATARNFEEAMAMVEREKRKGSGTKIADIKRKFAAALRSRKITRYSDELLEFMGGINWDREGAEWRDISDSHPCKPVFDAMGIIKEDVDDLVRERKQSEERYRTILENIEDGYFEVDLAGNITFLNDALCRIVGYSRDELIGLNNREYMDAETAAKVYKAYSRVYRTGEPIKGFEYGLLKDGKLKHVETSVSLMKDWNAQPIGFRGILRDVSKRKQAEQEILEYSGNLEAMVLKRTKDLKTSEEKYRTILENIEDGYYEVDLAGNLTFCNDAACEMLGYSCRELMGVNTRDYTDEETARKLHDECKKVYETGVPTKRIEWEGIRKDGTRKFLEASVSLIAGPEGQSTGFRGILRDVTERKELECEIVEKRRQAEEGSKAKSEFLANMSHEIRTPLNGIIGMAELVLDTELNDNQKDLFHTIQTEANSLQDLINEILDFSKIEAGKLDFEEIPFDLRLTLEDVANSFAYRAEQKGLAFHSFLAPDVPSRLIGDPGRLRQILVNLAGNALKFTREGEIYIKAEIAENSEHKVKVRFLIKDSGIGIPRDKQETIFESFRQADGSTTRKYGGTGLGTTISKRLAELMGGEIGVESEVDKGSTFWFTATFRKQEGKERLCGAMDSDLKDLKVLIVDDNPTSQFILVEYLKFWGSRSTVATSGEEALQILKDAVSAGDPFSLILTDFQMPGMSGFDLAKAIRATAFLEKIPIIVLTSVGGRGDGRTCMEIGINGYLTKPVRRDDLGRSILSVLDVWVKMEDRASQQLVTRHSLAEEAQRNLHILLAEDYPTNQLVAMRYLTSGGYLVDLAENGRQAVDAFKAKQFDLILMDIQMPIMDGYEATREIRKIETRNPELENGDMQNPSSMVNRPPILRKVPIVAMTAHAFKGDRTKCLDAGMDDYISKPLRKKNLLDMVEKWTGGVADRRSKIEVRKTDHPPLPAADPAGDAPMDFEKALEEFEGDEAFLAEVLEGFRGNVKSQIKTIHQALTDGNVEVVGKEAHSIKGGAGNLTAEKLAGIARELEDKAKSGVLDGGFSLLERLEKEFQRLEVYVDKRSG